MQIAFKCDTMYAGIFTNSDDKYVKKPKFAKSWLENSFASLRISKARTYVCTYVVHNF